MKVVDRSVADSSLLLGDMQLDQDHQEFHRLVVQYMESPFESSADALNQLRVHALAHFESEDRDLERLGGHNAQCHLDEHVAVLKSMEEVHSILVDSSTLQEAGSTLSKRLATELLRWLPEHVDQMDAGIASARAKERLGGTPVIFPNKTGVSRR